MAVTGAWHRNKFVEMTLKKYKLQKSSSISTNNLF